MCNIWDASVIILTNLFTALNECFEKNERK